MRSEDHEELGSWSGRSRSIRLRQGMPRARGGSCAWPRARGSARSPPSNRGTRRWRHSPDGGASAWRGRGAARPRDVRLPVPEGSTFGWRRPRLPVSGRLRRTAVRSPTCRAMTCAPIEVSDRDGWRWRRATRARPRRPLEIGGRGKHARTSPRRGRPRPPGAGPHAGDSDGSRRDARQRSSRTRCCPPSFDCSRTYPWLSSRCFPLASLVQEVPSTRRRRPREKLRRAGRADARATAVPERNGLFHSDTFRPN